VRLKTMTRVNVDSPSLLNRAQTWTLDGPGNWSNIATTPPAGGSPVNEARLDTSFNEYYQIGSSTYPTHDDNGNQTYDGSKTFYWDAMNRLTKWTVGSPATYFWRYIYDAQNRRVAKYYIYHEEPPEAMLWDRAAKLYCAASARSAGFSLLASAWTRGEGVNPYLGAPVRESSAGVPPANPEKRGLAPARPYPPVPVPCFSTSYTSYDALTTEHAEDTETVRGGSDWLDERATEALLTRAGVLCHDPQYPVYEKQTFAYDGWRVIQEHKKAAYGTGIPLATAIPVARQFAYGNYLDEALTVDADTDSDGDCIDSGGSTRYYYHQNSLFNVVALSDASANYKEGYQYDPYGRHVRITDGNDADTYVNFNTNDARSALATSAYGNPYLFTGQRLDSESGLYYYKNRYYSTTQGRFISRDPIGYGAGEHLYLYCSSTPTSGLDPEGTLNVGGCIVGGACAAMLAWHSARCYDICGTVNATRRVCVDGRTITQVYDTGKADWGCVRKCVLDGATSGWRGAVFSAVCSVAAATCLESVFDPGDQGDGNDGSTDPSDQPCPDKCPPRTPTGCEDKPCVPPVGTIRFQLHDDHDHGGMGNHTVVWVMHQGPPPACKCRWNKTYLPGLTPPPGAEPMPRL
jgi:RHS repeat-associated protein